MALGKGVMEGTDLLGGEPVSQHEGFEGSKNSDDGDGIVNFEWSSAEMLHNGLLFGRVRIQSRGTLVREQADPDAAMNRLHGKVATDDACGAVSTASPGGGDVCHRYSHQRRTHDDGSPSHDVLFFLH
ncbi:hypothetical protein C5D35_01440 [Rathayibacter toxicus]|nr:hypothetical protein C5D35_01440 [Rathayibacter toxicus]